MGPITELSDYIALMVSVDPERSSDTCLGPFSYFGKFLFHFVPMFIMWIPLICLEAGL